MLNLVVPRVVTGEKNSPTAAHAVCTVKGRSNGYPVPRDISEPPCPGDYK